MSNRTLLYIAIALLSVLLLIIAGVIVFFVLNNEVDDENTDGKDNETTEEDETENIITTSEQPDMTKFNEYFTSIELGKLPIGVQVGPPNGIPQAADEFNKDIDQFCTNMTIIKTIPTNSVSAVWYNADTKSNLNNKVTLPQALQIGGSSGCESIINTAGRYEYKIYVDDVLVADLPFQVE